MSETAATPSAGPTIEAPSALPSDVNTAPSDAVLRGEAPEAPAAEPSEPAEPKTVPLAALHEERAKRRERDEQIRRFEQRFADIQQLLQRQAQPKPPEPPSVDVDPVGHFKAKTEELEQRLAQVQQPLQQQAAAQQFAQTVGSYEAQYRAEVPDYDAAVQHLQRAWAQEAALMGVSPMQIAQQVAITALQQGRNPADVAYNLAKARGYGGPPVAPQAAPNPGMEAIQRGQQAARSAAAAPAPSEANLTINRLAAMDLRDFAKIPDDQWRKMMGG